MYFKFSKTFIVLIFVGFSPHLVKGMRNALITMQTGEGSGQSSTNLNFFSLSELSFLMKILNKIDINEDYKTKINEDYKPIEVLLNDKGVEVIREDNLQVDHEFIGDFQRKIRAVIEHFNKILEDYHEEFNQKYENNKTIGRRSRIAEERSTAMARRLTFINKRLGAYKKIVNEEEYNQFIHNYNLNINEFGAQHNVNNRLPDSLKNIRREAEFTQLEAYLTRILDQERNLFLLYKMFLLARRLILTFIYQSDDGRYFSMFDGSQSQIALLTYILLFDDYELAANRLRNMLLYQFHAFEWFAGVSGRQQSIILIKDLPNDEKDLARGYPVFCVFDQNVEEYYPLIYQFMKTTSSTEITLEEFAAFELFRIQGEGIEDNTYNLYQLINSEYVLGRLLTEGKLHEHYINPQLITQIRNQLDYGALVYNDQLMTTIEIREGVAIPPQIRGLYIYVPPPEAAGSSGEGNQEAAGSSGEGGQQAAGSSGEGSQQAAGRRRQRDGDGNGGNGGNGHRGRGRRRRNGRGRNGGGGGNGDGGN